MTKQQLEADLAVKMHQVLLLKQKLERNIASTKKLEQQNHDLRLKLQHEEHEAVTLRESLIALNGVPSDIALMRQKVFALRSEAREKTITVGRREDLFREIADLKKKIREECKHPFVLSYDGYAGSSSDDHSDYVIGERVCVVCGFSDRELEAGSDKYAVLAPSNERMIKRDLRRHELHFNRTDVWRPLEQYLEVFYQSSGCMNACWPKEKKAK